MPDGYQVLCSNFGRVTRFIRLNDEFLRCSVGSLHGRPAKVIGEAWRICASVRVHWVRDGPWRDFVGSVEPTPPVYRRHLTRAHFADGWSGWITTSTIVPMTPAQMTLRRLEMIERGDAMPPWMPGFWLGAETKAELELQEQRYMRYWRELSRAVRGLPPSSQDPWSAIEEWPPSRNYAQEAESGATYDEPDR